MTTKSDTNSSGSSSVRRRPSEQLDYPLGKVRKPLQDIQKLLVVDTQPAKVEFSKHCTALALTPVDLKADADTHTKILNPSGCPETVIK
jgi:hypothetical protein